MALKDWFSCGSSPNSWPMLPRRHWQARFIACINGRGIGLSFKMNGLCRWARVSDRSFWSLPRFCCRPRRYWRRRGRSRRLPRPAVVPAKAAAAQPGAPVPGNPAPLPQIAPPVVAPTPPPLPPAIWDALNAQDLLYYIQQIGREGLNPADYDPAGLIAAMRRPRSAGAVEGSDRPLQSLVVGPRARPRRRRPRADGMVRRRPGPRRGAAGRAAAAALAQHRITAALHGLLPTHPQYAALRRRWRSRRRPKRPRSTASASTWTAGAGCRATLASKYIIVNVPGFHAALVENGVNRVEAPGGRRRDQDADAATVGDGDRRDAQSLVGSADEHRRRKSRQDGLRAGQEQGRQAHPLAPAAGADQRARPGQVRDVQPAEHLPARHQCPQPLRQPDARAQPRLHPHRAYPRPRRPSCSATMAATWTPDKIQATLATGKRKSRRISSSRCRSTSSISARPRSSTARSWTITTSTAATPR